MSRYHCCFVGEDNRLMDFELLSVSNDEEAVRRAGQLLQSRSDTLAAEIWRGGKFVTRVSSVGNCGPVH